jgi:hypothetical protein
VLTVRYGCQYGRKRYGTAVGAQCSTLTCDFRYVILPHFFWQIIDSSLSLSVDALTASPSASDKFMPRGVTNAFAGSLPSSLSPTHPAPRRAAKCQLNAIRGLSSTVDATMPIMPSPSTPHGGTRVTRWRPTRGAANAFFTAPHGTWDYRCPLPSPSAPRRAANVAAHRASWVCRSHCRGSSQRIRPGATKTRPKVRVHRHRAYTVI